MATVTKMGVREMKKTSFVLIAFIVIFFFLAGCDAKKSEPDFNEIKDGEETLEPDDDAFEGNDFFSEEEREEEEKPDEENKGILKLKCPETVDELVESICEIETSYSLVKINSNSDNCGGEIFEENGKFVYKFTPTEEMGPGTCTASITEADYGTESEATIEILEVNEPPVFTSMDLTMFFYEHVIYSKEFYVHDSDYPNQLESDPGFFDCFIADNECGDWISVQKDSDKCVVSGTMPEELTNGECHFKLVVKDGYGAEASKTISATLFEENRKPQWVLPPTGITLFAGEEFDEINGVATDPDLPNEVAGDPGFITCVYDSSNCSFDISVETIRDETNEVSCKVAFTAGNLAESCYFQIEVNDGINSLVSNIIPINVKPYVALNCPESVNEEEEIVCDISALGGEPFALDWSQNTCHGDVSNEYGQWKYRYLTTEMDGPEFCNVAVGVGEAIATAAVEIKEINMPPELTFYGDCKENPSSSNAAEHQNFACNAVVSDSDLPLAEPTDPGYTTCKILNNTCGSWLVFEGCLGQGKPDEESGGTSCSYTVEASDGYGEKVSQTVNITIAEHNYYPQFTVEPPSPISLMTGEIVGFTYSATDSDLPNSSEDDPGFLKCSATIENANSIVTSTGTGSGAVTCSVEIRAYDYEECLVGAGCKITFAVTDGQGGKSERISHLRVSDCIFYVKEDGTGTGGRSWSDAFGTIQKAVDASWSGCKVWVKQGTYTSPAKDGSPVLTMKEGVEIIGGFEGGENPKHDIPRYRTRPELLVHSVLDGEDASHHVVVGAFGNAVLDGFIIKGGNAVGVNDDDKSGGGMFNKSTVETTERVIVKNSIFTGNYAENSGGAIYSKGTTNEKVIIEKVLFENNEAGESGGAVFGKKIYNTACTECTFKNNSSQNLGGAIFDNSSNCLVKKSSFIENSTKVGNGSGGAIYSYESLEVENSIFIKNSSTFDGAITGNHVTINHSTFSKNKNYSPSSTYLYAVYLVNGTITNSIFWESDILFQNEGVVTYSFGTGITGTGNIETIPSGADLFISADTNLRLDPKSPAIKAADPNSTLVDDIEGTLRTHPKDMGAYIFNDVSADLFVDCGVSVPGDGSSWSSPLKSLQAAVDELKAKGGVIFVSGGVCRYSEIGGDEELVKLYDNIQIYGGFYGSEQYLRERVNPQAYPTVLDGENENITVIKVEGDGKNVIIDGLTIKNGYNSGFVGALNDGSGVYNSIFINNRGANAGGMKIEGTPYHTLESSKIVNTLFVNNIATDNSGAGAIYFPSTSSTNVEIINCNFIYNFVVTLLESYDYAAINGTYSSPHYSIKNSIFYQNRGLKICEVGQAKGSNDENMTHSINNDANPLFQNVPETVWMTSDDRGVSSIELYSEPTGITEDYFIEINNDGIKRTITSIYFGNRRFDFDPPLDAPSKRGDIIYFWAPGTTNVNLDFRLKWGSPCINNGTFVDEAVRDITEKRRFFSSDPEILFDIGAYEY